MGILPFSLSATMNFQTIPNVLLLTYETRMVNALKWNKEKNNPYLANAGFYSKSIFGTPPIPVKCKGKSCGDTSDEGTEYRALETVLRLYSSIKNKDLQELSDVIGEECRCMSNFLFAFKPLHGKQQVLEFFMTLMRVMGNHVEFVIQPTLYDGTNVGLQWTLECSKTHAPLGKGFSFYTAHSYKGKLVIRNVEMFMEPILHIEPLRLKLIGVLSQFIARLGLLNLFKKKMNGYLLFISLLSVVASIYFLRILLN